MSLQQRSKFSDIESKASKQSKIEKHLQALSFENDVPIETVYELYDLYGDEELYDGLVSAVEDVSGGW